MITPLLKFLSKSAGLVSRMIPPVSFLKRIDFGFAALSLFIVAANFFMLKPTTIPRVDTLGIFFHYHYFYSSLLFHHQFAQWLPYGTYGFPIFFYQLCVLSPFAYLSFLSGLVLNAQDVLRIFKFSVLAEQLTFLAGIYTLARLLYSRRSTVFFVCLAAAGSVVWYAQIFFNFRIYYLYPWAVYLIFGFFEKKNAAFLWLSGLVCIAWSVGNAIYFPILWFYLLATTCALLSIRNGAAWLSLFSRNKSNVMLFLPFALILLVHGYFFGHLFDFTALTAQGRNQAGTNALQDFLTYGGNTPLPALLQSFIFGAPAHLPIASGLDNSVYIGILPLFFFVWAILKVRGLRFYSFLLPALCLVLLSFGGFFARLIYSFPFTAYYRHVGLVLGFAKILMLICAGFGLDDFQKSSSKTKTGFSFVVAGIFILLFSLYSPLHESIVSQWLSPFLNLPSLKISFHSAFFRIGIYVFTAILLLSWQWIGRTLSKTRPFKIHRSIIAGLWILALSLDLLSFQASVSGEALKVPPEQCSYLRQTYANKLEFQNTRTFYPLSARQNETFALIPPQSYSVTYWPFYNFVQWDPCISNFRIDICSAEVNQLFKAQGTSLLDFDQRLYPVIGCNTPKIRLLSKAVFPNNPEEATGLIRTTPFLDHIAILQDVPPELRISRSSSAEDAETSGTFNVTNFSPNELLIEAEVISAGGVWLVYADAWHPGWHATVNGKKALIAKAYLAFKAVYLEKGKNIVRFYFQNGLMSAISVFIAIFGISISLVFIFLFLAILFNIKFIRRFLDVTT